MYYFLLGIGCTLFVLSVIWWLVRQDRTRRLSTFVPSEQRTRKPQPGSLTMEQDQEKRVAGIVKVAPAHYNGHMNCGKCGTELSTFDYILRRRTPSMMCPACACWVFRQDKNTTVTYGPDAQAPTANSVRTWIRRNAARKEAAQKKSDEKMKQVYRGLYAVRMPPQLEYEEVPTPEELLKQAEEAGLLDPKDAPAPSFLQDDAAGWENRLADVLPEKVRPPPSGKPAELAAFELDNDTPPPYSDDVDDNSG